ncbi:hypothetical protein Ga0466249_004779 [Sporomusaceae bacterium BoRhaA]|nr:hypothetical protein [Pelorhabdus rhamnosifermentans]
MAGILSFMRNKDNNSFDYSDINLDIIDVIKHARGIEKWQ